VNVDRLMEATLEALRPSLNKARLAAAERALTPLLEHVRELREQNAGLLRVLRGQSGAVAPLSSLLPDDDPD
jgi:hypothetical protein